MSRRLEIRTRMAELQKEFSALNAEVKEIEAEEKRQRNLEKFTEYKFKVGTYGHKIEEEDKMQEATDDDRAVAAQGSTGLVWSGFEGSNYGFVLLKAKEDYSRTKRILEVLEAATQIADEKVKDKGPHLKVLLGE